MEKLEDLIGLGMKHCDKMIKTEKGNYCPYKTKIPICNYQGKMTIYCLDRRKTLYICIKRTK